MTINELEQGLRNLIATQPMVTAGSNGEVINGINSLIDAYRNFSFRISSYPSQDVLKFGIANELSKIENTLSSLACQVMQERGINLMLYIVPRTAPGYNGMVNSYGMVGSPVDANLMMGQMMYQQSSMPSQSPMMQMPNAMPQMGRPGMVQQPYNQMQPAMQGIANSGYAPRAGQRAHAPTYPGYANPDRPVKLEPTNQTEQLLRTRTAPQSKIKTIEKPAPVAKMSSSNNEEPGTATIEVAKAPENAPSPAEMLMGTAKEGNAKGRDYLMELLKK